VIYSSIGLIFGILILVMGKDPWRYDWKKTI